MIYTLNEFQKLSGLSDSALLWLLRENRLMLLLHEGELRIDFRRQDMEAIIQALSSAGRMPEKLLQPEVVEAVSDVIREELASIVLAAIRRTTRAVPGE